MKEKLKKFWAEFCTHTPFDYLALAVGVLLGVVVVLVHEARVS